MALLDKFITKQFVDSIKTTFDELSTQLANIDFDALEKKADALKEKANKELNTMIKRIKELDGDSFVVSVKYDRDTESLKSFIKDNKLNTIVENIDTDKMISKSTQSVLIPNEFDIDSLRQRYVYQNKTMEFIFSKKKDSNKTEDKIEKEVTKTKFNKFKDDKPISKEEIAKKMYHMFKNGCSYRAIAKECGFSDKTCKKWINEMISSAPN